MNKSVLSVVPWRGNVIKIEPLFRKQNSLSHIYNVGKIIVMVVLMDD